MSRENVELVQSLYEAFNRRDYATAVECLHPAVEVYPAVVGLDPAGAGTTERWVGRDGVRQIFEDLGETWQRVTVVIQEVEEVADGRVLAVEDWHTRGRGGIGFVTRISDVYTIQDSLVVRVTGFIDKAEALEAVGLRESFGVSLRTKSRSGWAADQGPPFGEPQDATRRSVPVLLQ